MLRPGIAALLCLAALCACSPPRRPSPAPAAVPQAVEANPFDSEANSFVVSGPRFAPGETAIVKVCVAPDGAISSADLIGSSGDKRFDDFALVWARQVKLASAASPIYTHDLCGPVRVEIRAAPSPEVFSGRASALG